MRMFAQDLAFYRKVRVDETDDPAKLATVAAMAA